MKVLPAVWLIAIFLSSSHAEEASELRPMFRPYYQSLSPESFFEQFNYDDVDESGWKISNHKNDDGTRYEGAWAIEESGKNKGFDNDKGLVMKTAAARHAIARQLDTPIDNRNRDLVVQYEIKLQDGLDCGGTYIKLLGEGFDGNLHKDSHFVLMFGPDQCGTDDRIHLILNKYNPVSGEYLEHHLRTPPMSRGGHFSNLYTLVLHQDQTFEIRINGEVAKAGSLKDTTKFEPSLVPPTEILDTAATKPDDWDDREYIDDPNHPPKPDNYDELYAEPRVVDPNAVKPEDWDEEMPPLVPDPDASVPSDWNEETDGQWIPPLVVNPDCANGHCGTWNPPTILNPNFKGKWRPPQIKNHAYKGKWVPGYVPNPHFYENTRPGDLEPITALGFELWTLSANILFDNIYVGHSVAEAEHIGNTTFTVKQDLEGRHFATPKVGEQPLAPPDDFQSYIDEEELSVRAIFSAVQNILLDQVQEARAVYEEFNRRPYATIREKPMQCLVYSCSFMSLFTFFFGFASAIVFVISPPKTPAATGESQNESESEKKATSEPGDTSTAAASASGARTTTRSSARRRK